MSHCFHLAAGLLAALGAQAPWCPPQAPAPGDPQIAPLEQDGAEESTEPVAAAGTLVARVAVGRSPHASGMRIDVEGAQAHAPLCLEVGRLHDGRIVDPRRQILLADAWGRASFDQRGELGAGLGLRCIARTASGTVAASLAVSVPQSIAPTVAVQRGDIVIAEVMKDPTFVTDAHGEWFEIQNITNHPINIAGWKIVDLGSNSHTLSNNGQLIVLVPGQRFVLGNDKDPLTNGGVQVDYQYSNFTLGNGADSILLVSRKGDLIDQIDYDDGVFWPDVPGKSLTLHPYCADVYLNDIPANWCIAKTPLSALSPDLGTPGLFNDTCP